MKIFGAAVGLAGLIAAGSAHAGLLPGNALYSSYITNTPDSNSIAVTPGGGATPTGGGSPDAQQFYSPATTLESLTLRLSDPTPSDGGSILVYLVPNGTSNLPAYTSTSTLTGATKLGTILDSSLSTTAGNISLSIYDQLAAGTYWIALVSGSDTNNGGSAVPTTGALWYRTNDTIGLDVGNNVNNTNAGLYDAHIMANGAGWKTVSTNAFEMQINTPEPASLALLGAGLTGLGFIRRRRAKKSAK